MAAVEPEIRSFLPEPPPFYKHFTPENIERLKQFKADNAGASSPKLSPDQVLSLPPELRYLVPPKPPTEDGTFSVFGEVGCKITGNDDYNHAMEWVRGQLGLLWPPTPLENWKYEQLYPSPPTPAPGEAPIDPSSWTLDRQNYLFRFIRSALLCFVELVGVMAANPTSPDKDEKIKNIMTLIANMQALINEYRPHQARETLISIMERQLEKKKAEVEGIKRMSQKVEETLRGFDEKAPELAEKPAPEVSAAVSAEEKRKESQRHMWQAMDEILGH